MPDVEQEEREENLDEFDAAFAEYAGQADDAEDLDDVSGEGETDDKDNNEDNDFDTSFASAADEPAASDDEQEKDIAAELEATKAEIERLKQSDRSQRGRVSALTKKLVEQKAAASKPPKAGQDIAKDSDTDAGDGDDWEDFQREFPEMAAIVDKRLSKVSDRVEKVATTQDEFVNERILAYKLEQMDVLKDAHSDAEEIKVSPDFFKWRQSAPDEIKAKIKSHNAEDAADVLTAFKNETGWKGAVAKPAGKSEVELINERRNKALKASAGISSKKVGHSSRQDTESSDDFDSAFKDGSRQKEKQRSLLR